MNQFIKIGGLMVIVAVFGIFVFILIQIAPLFRGARISELANLQVQPGETMAFGMDEWAALPFVADAAGMLRFYDSETGALALERPLPHVAERGLGSVDYDQSRQTIAIGTADGHFSVAQLRYRPIFEADGARRVEAEIEAGPLFRIGEEGAPVVRIAYADGGARKLAVALQESGGRQTLHAETLVQRRSLMGAGKIAIEDSFDLTSLVEGRIVHMLAPAQADAALVANEAGEVFYLTLESGAFRARQRFAPFEDKRDPSLASLEFVFGDVTFVASSRDGELRGYSLFVDPEAGERTFGRTKSFAPSLEGGADFYAGSGRNKAFLVGAGRGASLFYSTTEALRWRGELPFEPARALIGGKYDRLAFLGSGGELRIYALDDPHPEASWKAFFGEVWYEGAPEPKFDWQSTGGSDDFEPKLSLAPLVFGSIKGTFYALLFAVPIALLAALYTSQFLKPEIKTIVKPVMEIMASLPSVVLGFLAALWLAPLVETRVPSLLAVVVALPAAALLLGWGWSRLPPRARLLIPPGWEFLAFFPAMLVAGWLAWSFGPALEAMLFVVEDPTTGQRIADFRLWWPKVVGAPFEQRNSLVVGFMMGFAVIPIIFTIAEDALSNVPQSLRSASLALGASRWQTAFRVVLPTASAGIFSALMIGLGRAVGETMIVVMATGNTPIMEWNVFSGMRTLAANIAVELPEAPHHGTLYRTLFLGALVLFMMTFAVNTAAEVMRQRLRERYKTVD